MSNPWTKKNPWMSLWLSAANQVANTAAGQVRAQAQAQTTRSLQQGWQDAMSLWTGWLQQPAAMPSLASPPPPARKRRTAAPATPSALAKPRRKKAR